MDKTKVKSEIKKAKCLSAANWDTAIADAEEMIRKATGDITGLKASIRYFKQQKERGLPFPGTDFLGKTPVYSKSQNVSLLDETKR